MGEEQINEPAPEVFQPYEVPGVGIVTEHQGDTYVVATPTGAVHGHRSPSGTPSQEHAAEEIAYAIANPPAFPNPVPSEITRAQFVIAARKVLNLREGGIYALISQLPAGETQEDARDLFENASTFKRAHPFLTALAGLNQNTPEQIDDVFRLGGTLNQ